MRPLGLRTVTATAWTRRESVATAGAIAFPKLDAVADAAAGAATMRAVAADVGPAVPGRAAVTLTAEAGITEDEAATVLTTAVEAGGAVEGRQAVVAVAAASTALVAAPSEDPGAEAVDASSGTAESAIAFEGAFGGAAARLAALVFTLCRRGIICDLTAGTA